MAMGFVIAPIWVFWCMKDDIIAKLVTITAFVRGFALWLVVSTAHRRRDVFVVLAVYGAALVVYIGSVQKPGS